METPKPNTRKSIYPPIEVTLDGEVYQSRKFTHPMMIEKEPYEKAIDSTEPKKDESDVDFGKRQWDAYCNWMRIVFGVPTEKMEEAEFSEIEDVYMEVKTGLLKRQGNRMEKHVTEIKAVTAKIEKSTDSVAEVVQKAEKIAKNVKRPGKKT